jgi:hypothetical protein
MALSAQTMCTVALQPHPSFFSDFYIFYSCVSSLIANVTIFGNVRTDHVHISTPTLSLIFFSDFVHILQLFFLHDCQCDYTDHVHQPSNLIPHFFLIFCIFYSCVSSLLANVTIFRNMRTDHVHIGPPTSSLIFSDF